MNWQAMQQNTFVRQNDSYNARQDGAHFNFERNTVNRDFNRQNVSERQDGGGGVKRPFGDLNADEDVDGKRMRKPLQRRTIDYCGSVVRGIEMTLKRRLNKEYLIKPDASYVIDVLLPSFNRNNSILGVTSRFVQQAQNKIRCPVNVIKWTPEGRRLLTGSSSGEFTLWNGSTFNFETIMQAHDTAVRAMEWSHDTNWLVSGDQGGIIKYWQPNMNNVKVIHAHNESVRDISFSPSDTKFATASDDRTIKIWDFNEGQEETALQGHGWDVKCVDWHSKLGLIASGGKDNLIKLWDPRSKQCLNTIHSHNNTVLGLNWNKNGWWLLSGGRDSSIRIYDIRKMDELKSFRGIPKEVTTIEWHPVYETLFASGGSDGAVMIWDTNHKDHLHSIPNAHDSYVWSVTWHPLGHLLATGSNDHTTKFWTRARPGDELESTEFGIPAPLPPGAMNASSLMHGSCSAYKTQGHTAGGQNATTTSEGVSPLSFLQNGQKNMPSAQSQPAPPLVGSSKGPTDSFLRNIPNFQGSNKNTTRGGERTGNYGYSAAPNKVGYNNRISPSPTNHFPGQDRGGDSSFYPPGLSGSGRTSDSVGRSTQDFPNSDRKARDASSRVPTQQSRPPSRPPVLGGIPGLGASNTQFSTNPSKSRSQNK